MTTAGATLRVVLVDDHQLIRDGLRRAFDRAGDIEVVGEAGSIAEALHALDRLRPDVLVTDVKLPDGDGISLTTQVRSGNPTMGIVVLTMYAGDDQVFAALDAGASGFVGKDAPAEEVVAAARHAAANPRAFTARDLAGAMQRRMSAPAGPKLSRGSGRCWTCWSTVWRSHRSPAGSTSASRRPRLMWRTSTRSSAPVTARRR